MTQCQGKDGLSQASGSTLATGCRKRNYLRKDLQLSETFSDDDNGFDDRDSDHSSRPS